MSTFGDFTRNIGLAMAGKNPWGSGGNSGDGGNGGDSGGQSGGESGGDKPKGPRNPWLPTGGNGGSDGPRRSANVEDIFKKRGGGGSNGGGPSGPNFQMPQRPGGKSWLPIAFGLIILVGLATSMIHQVGPKEQATVKTFGYYSRTLPSGFHITLPWPAAQVDVENVSEFRAVRMPDGSEQKLILTGDQNLVDLSYLIRWSINDLRDFKYRLADPVETVKEVAEAAMRASVAEKTLDDTFSGEGRAQIEERVRTRMQAVLDGYKAGITVQGIEIDKTDPPAEVVDAFKDVTVAEQDADAARNRARGFAQQVLAGAEGETIAFDKVYEQYRLAPRVTRQRLYYETMERVLRDNDKTIIETEGVTPYLPLPEIRKRAQESAITVNAPPPSPAPSSARSSAPTQVQGQ